MGALGPGIGMTWTDPDFPDGGWDDGTYGIGYEATTGAENLLETTVPPNVISVYTRVRFDVVNAAVEKAYGGEKKISWMEIYTGEKAAELYDGDWFPEETLDAEIQKILDLGVELKCGVKIGKDVSLDELKESNDAVYVALGAQQGISLGVDGEDAPNVFAGVDFLNRFHHGHGFALNFFLNDDGFNYSHHFRFRRSATTSGDQA